MFSVRFVSTIPLILALAGLGQLALAHPQDKIFPSQHAYVEAAANPQGQVIMVNPSLAGEDFGLFTVPTQEEMLLESGNLEKAKALWSVARVPGKSEEKFFVPPETGRALMLEPSSHAEYRDILIKGTGAVEKFTANNRLRPAELGMDGFFEVSEAVRDMQVAEILHQSGAMVARGVAIVDQNNLVERKGMKEPLRMGNYVRAFRVQTRLSNLVDLKPKERKAAIDDAIGRLHAIFGGKPMTYAEYFQFMSRSAAKTAAIYQRLGFTQDSLHSGQMTLAGEVTDLGVGTFVKPKKKGVMNTKYPWFRYERQPLLFQNMLYRTHVLKSEPAPELLKLDSGAASQEGSLLGFIRSFDPKAADEIERANPEQYFWTTYEDFYRQIPAETIRDRLVDKFDQFHWWNTHDAIKKVPVEKRFRVVNDYEEILKKESIGWDHAGRWGPKGPPASVHELAFVAALKKNGIDPKPLIKDIATTPGPWAQLNANRLFDVRLEDVPKDISWKPSPFGEFHAKKFGAHPLASLLKEDAKLLEPGSKIIYPVDGQLSPFAVIKGFDGKKFTVAYEDPVTGKIKEDKVWDNFVTGFNNPSRAYSEGAVVGGAEIKFGPKLKKREAELREYADKLKLKPNFAKDTPEEILRKQYKYLLELTASANTPYQFNLGEKDNEKYVARLKARLSGEEIMPLEKAMWKGCGNCMDQTSFTGALLEKTGKEYGLSGLSYIARDDEGKKHWYLVATAHPSQEQFIVESSFGGPKVVPFRNINYYPKFPIAQVIDQFGPKAECPAYFTRLLK
jgi:hypothetical protein